MVQPPRSPDLEAQQAAMKKLDFLVGKWTGEARLARGAGETIDLAQTEEAGFRLGGLILVIEGVGRAKSSGATVLQAFGIISYEDDSQTYFMRAFNDGRFLETEIKLLEEGKGMTWGFALGEIKTKSLLRINENGEWTELHEIIVGSQPSRKLMEVAVRRHT
jgi:hypothetical protein